jgi:hypothetical protein
MLPRVPGQNRWAENSALAALEAGWSLPVSEPDAAGQNPEAVRVIACANPEAEAASGRARSPEIRPRRPPFPRLRRAGPHSW